MQNSITFMTLFLSDSSLILTFDNNDDKLIQLD